MAAMLNKLLRVFQLVFSAQPDTSTESGRSRDRYRRAALSSMSLVLNRGCMILVGLVSIPLALKHLGDERFGIWMAILGVAQMVRIADFGLGSSLVSKLSTLRDKEHAEQAQASVSTVAVLLGLVAVFVVITYGVLSQFIDWAKVFGAETALGRAEAAPTMTLVCCLVSLDFALNVVRVTHTALQEAYVNNLFRCGGILAGFGLMLLAIHFELGMPALVGSYMLGPILGDFANGIHLFWRSHPRLRPSLRAVRWDIAKSLTLVGGWFLLMQVSVATIVALPRLVIAELEGATAVVPYAIVERVYFYLTFVTGMIVGPLWPAYSEANSKGEYAWIHKTLRRTFWLCIGVTFLAGMIPLLFGESGFRLLTRQPLDISRSLIFAFLLYLVGFAVTQVYNSFLLGVKKTRQVALSLLSQMVFLLAVIYPATKIWGIEGAAFSLACSTWVTRGWIFPLLASRWIKKHITAQAAKNECSSESKLSSSSGMDNRS